MGHVPIVFITAVADELSFILRGYEMGAIDDIIKPIDSLVVSAKVSLFVEMFAARKAMARKIAESNDVRATNATNANEFS